MTTKETPESDYMSPDLGSTKYYYQLDHEQDIHLTATDSSSVKWGQ